MKMQFVKMAILTVLFSFNWAKAANCFDFTKDDYIPFKIGNNYFGEVVSRVCINEVIQFNGNKEIQISFLNKKLQKLALIKTKSFSRGICGNDFCFTCSLGDGSDKVNNNLNFSGYELKFEVIKGSSGRLIIKSIHEIKDTYPVKQVNDMAFP